MGVVEALVSFLGGTAFRMIWGEVSSWVSRRQDHAHELEMLRQQSMLEGQRHERDMARVKQAHELGIKEIQIAGDVAVQRAEADAFIGAIRAAQKPTGIAWVDAWNGCIRPLAATMCLALWASCLVAQGFVLDEWDISLIGVVIGFFFADRSLGKRGK